jgi:drug/metabolite transporter (DMT)-like permease
VAQHVQPSGILSSVGVGVSFCLVTVGLYATFEAGAPISLASLLIRLGGLLIASAVGLLFWDEPLTLRYALGVALVCGGVYLIEARKNMNQKLNPQRVIERKCMACGLCTKVCPSFVLAIAAEELSSV